MAKLRTLKPRIGVLKGRLPTMQPGSWRTSKQTSGQRGYDYRWQQAREQYLMEHPLCVFCQAEGRAVAANVVDHKIAHRGDQELFWDRDNWQSLCPPCHSSTKQREEAQG